MNNFLSHFYPFLRRVGYLLIPGASLWIGIFFIYRSLGASAERFVEVKVVPVEASSRVRALPPVAFDSFADYHTIIDNNLFRPLGWTPPRPKEPYRLLGTIHPTDDRTPLTAILQSTARNKTYIVTTGEPLDASTEVVEIKSKQVVLSTEGQRRTLKLTTHYLNPSQVAPRLVSSRRSTPQRPPQSVRRTPTPPRAPTAALSQWQTRDGEIIRIGDARLKNPVKWELQRR